MRFTVILALVVATFFACISFTNADALPESGRNLRAQQIGAAGTAATNLFKADDVAAGATHLFKADDLAVKTDELAAKADDMAAKYIEAAYEKKFLAHAAKMAGGAEDVAKLTTKETDQLTTMVAATVKKNPSKWPKIKKFLLYSLGAGVAGTIIYQVGKAQGQSAATTTAA
ncbi:hypothetical protein PR001_g15470 [Phytophthora rubi]|uniref:RxLR effector protein n=1 Tax=Phytophthora rubi TaxID=129364 RepID=A0A6A3KM31_9STRA|nr:hypothetical protein PR002_g15888 [Phytophthora rubi]KAE9013188.1 hypothetical protein PR001_g15470 [Phytophthora rubi]